MVRIFFMVVMGVMAGTTQARAQGVYVSASLLGEILRSTSSETSGASTFSTGGEALGVAIRVGTRLGSNWGLEAEFATASEIENEQQLPNQSVTQSAIVSILPGLPAGVPVRIESSAITFQPFNITTSREQMTLTSAAWIAQQLSSRVALVYTAGASFYRSEQELEFESPRRLLPPSLPISFVLTPISSETTTFGVRVMVGIESRATLTDHLNIVGGVRLHAGDNLWLIRPGVGIGWTF